MKNKLTMLLAAGALALGAQQTQAISIDFSNVPGAELEFAGDTTFTFNDSALGVFSGYDFIIGSVSGGDGTPDSVGLMGNITGTFTIGAVSGSPESAPVTSSFGAKLSIFDGTTTFIGDIDWIKLTRDGTSGDLNISGSVNLTGITYTGTVQDLLDLKGDSDTASATIGFTFNPAKSIAELKSENLVTGYSGDLTSVPDGGTTLMLLGTALSGLFVAGRRFRK